MDRSSHQVRMEQWASIIHNQASSNMTKVAWCKENNISLRQFFYYQRKLRDLAIESQHTLPQSLSSSANFCELSIPDNEPEPLPSAQTSDITIEINGCLIHIDDSVSPHLLRTVIEVLRHV